MPIGHRHGPGLLLGVVAFQQPGGTAPQRAAYLRRLAAFPAYLDALAANAREGSPAAWSRLELEALREEWVAGGGDVRGFHVPSSGSGCCRWSTCAPSSKQRRTRRGDLGSVVVRPDHAQISSVVALVALSATGHQRISALTRGVGWWA
jgi:hypothetical protein